MMQRKCIIFSLVIVFLLTTVLSFVPATQVYAETGDLVPAIEVKPGTSVQVGEAVLFSGEGTIYLPDQNNLKHAQFEWDFGDGYKLSSDTGIAPNRSSTDSGISAVHYFMEPGEFTVTLKVSVYDAYDTGSTGVPVGNLIEQESKTVTINVTGEKPMDGFELLFAPLSSRLAQYITVVVPESVRTDAENRLLVTLIKGGSVVETLLDKIALQETEQFLLEQRELSKGDYELVVELKDAQGNLIGNGTDGYGIWKEKFSYAGEPYVGIDENNAICIDGDPTFITSPYQMKPADVTSQMLDLNAFNSMYYMSYYANEVYTQDTWEAFANEVGNKGLYVIGPGRGSYLEERKRNNRNISLEELQEYAYANGNIASLIVWDWSYLSSQPSSNMKQEVPPQVLASWTYAAGAADTDHPTMVRLKGNNYTPWYNGNSSVSGHYYDYRNSDKYSGKKSFYAHILNLSDLYPMNSRPTQLAFEGRGFIDNWVESIENFVERNYNLVPISVTVEAGLANSKGYPAINHDQVLMESWLAAIHGAKMINWVTMGASNIQYAAMGEFTTAMETFDDIFLGANVEQPVTDDCNVRAKRVDSVTRQGNDGLYLFAARLTEPERVSSDYNYLQYVTEPESITTVFTVPGLTTGRVEKLDKDGKIIRGGVLPIENGQFTDTFNKCEVAIYRITDGDPNANYEPVVDHIEDKEIKVGLNLNFTISASDPESDALTFTSDNLPSGASLNEETGVFNWMPEISQLGSHEVTFKITDEGSNEVTTTVNIEVVEANIQRIAITSPPTRTNYYVGETLDLSGMIVTGSFDDGSSAQLLITLDHISGFDSSRSASNQTVTVTYEDFTATFKVNILYDDLVPHIEVRPGKNIDVNEEVLFSAEGTTYSEEELLNTAWYQWDFGDGYGVQSGKPTASSKDRGMAVTHYFMKPGTFTVTLKVSVYNQISVDGVMPEGDPIVVKSTTEQITVTGVEPMKDFELLHAPFTPRISQFITATLPSKVTRSSDNRLKVWLESESLTEDIILLDKTGLSAEEEFELDHEPLPRGDYKLIAEITDAEGNRLDGGLWVEKFSKTYDGVPYVGINKWNAECIEGEPFFPVTPYMLHPEWFDLFEGAINSTHTIGEYEGAGNDGHTPEMWLDYIERSAEAGWYAMGPGRGEYCKNARNGVNISVDSIREFVSAVTNNEDAFKTLLNWNWFDEPNIGGQGKQVHPAVMAAQSYATKEVDQQHPVSVTNEGYIWLSGRSNYKPYYDYESSTLYNARHSFYGDIYCMDIYPLEYRLESQWLFNLERGAIDLFAEAIDNCIDVYTGNLVPFMACIECCDIRSYRETPGPTGDQVLMESWLAVVHGSKGVLYFPFFEYDTIQYDAMREFATAMDTFGKIILGPDRLAQITDNSDIRTKRVDSITRVDEETNELYLFTVRITEADPLPSETNHQAADKIEPLTISTTFTIPANKYDSSVYNGRAEVLNENGQIEKVIRISNGKFTDTFKKNEYHVYRITGEGDLTENVAPAFGTIANQTGECGKALEFTVSATDANGDTITFTSDNLPQGANLNPATGEFTWTPSDAQAGKYYVAIYASDGNGGQSEQTVRIEVPNPPLPNRPPVFTAISDQSVSSGSLVEFTVSAADPDNDALIYLATDTPSGASFSSATKIFSWTPSSNQLGLHKVKFIVTDGLNPQVEMIVNIMVQSGSTVNQPPVFDEISDKTTDTGTKLEFTVSAVDPDNDDLIYTAGNLPTGASFNSATKTFNWTPIASQAGTYMVTFIVSDEKNLPVQKEVNITVNSSPNKPDGIKITMAAPAIVEKGEEFTVDVGFLSSENRKILVADLELTFDSGKFEFIECNEVNNGLNAEVVEGNETVRILLSQQGVQNAISDNVALVSLSFKAKESAGAGLISVTTAEFSAVGIEDESEPDVLYPDLAGATITVLEEVPDDIPSYSFIIEDTSINTEKGIIVNASVSSINEGGEAVVIFKLMMEDKVIGLHSSKQMISGTSEFEVRFHGYSGSQYKVKAYVWDKLDSSADSVGVDLAEPVDIQ